MTSSAVKIMILKFEAMSCLKDRHCSGQPSTSASATRTVQEDTEILAGSFMHGEVRAR